jgi:diguanylate cyclase (GGDEF)-like protein
VDKAPKQILVVDQSSAFTESLSRMLLELFPESRIRLAHSVSSALAEISANKPDVVLAALNLPDHSGDFVVQVLAQHLSSRPIIVLGESDWEELETRVLEAGAQDYLVKGEVSAHILRRAMRYAMQRSELQTELRKMALYDELTGLPNRRLLQERAGLHLATAHRTGQRVAALFVDINKFKEINDQRGHTAGDNVLIRVGQALEKQVRRTDSVARWGGDEFVVLTVVNSPDVVRVIADRLKSAIESQNYPDGLCVQATVGAAWQGSPLERIVDVVHRADVAMYQVRGGVHWQTKETVAPPRTSDEGDSSAWAQTLRF